MTTHSDKPVPTPSKPQTKIEIPLTDAELEEISGGKLQSSVQKTYNDSNSAPISKVG